MNIANRFKLLRKSLKKNQTEMGEILGITYGQVSNIERGISIPSNSLLKLVEEKYGENFGLPATHNLQQKTHAAGRQPGSYGMPDTPSIKVNKLIVEIYPDELPLINSIRALDKSDQIGVYKTVINLLRNLEQQKQTKIDLNKKNFIKNCISELDRSVSQSE